MTVRGSRMVVAVALGCLLIGVHRNAGAFPVDGDQTALPPKTELNEDALDKPREIFRPAGRRRQILSGQSRQSGFQFAGDSRRRGATGRRELR